MNPVDIKLRIEALASWTMFGLSLLLGGVATWLLARTATVTPYADQAVPLLNLAAVTATAGAVVLLGCRWHPRHATTRFALAVLLVLVVAGSLPLRAHVSSWKPSAFRDGTPAVALSWNAFDRNIHDVRAVDGVALVRSIDFTPPLRRSTKAMGIATCVPLDGALQGLDPDGPGEGYSLDVCGARPAP